MKHGTQDHNPTGQGSRFDENGRPEAFVQLDERW